MKQFFKDAALVVTTLVVLWFIMTMIGKELPIGAVLLGASVGLVAAAGRARRTVLEERARAAKQAARTTKKKR